MDVTELVRVAPTLKKTGSVGPPRGHLFTRLMQEGDTGLIFAAMGGHFDTVKLLIDRGAKIDIRNKVIRRLGLGLSNAGRVGRCAQNLEKNLINH